MIRGAVLVALVALSGVSASRTVLEMGTGRQQALEKAWSEELQPKDGIGETKVVDYKSPVKRVIGLLQKMKSELEHEAKNEAEMYDKMVCWCETNEKEKTKAVKDADAKDIELSGEIESRSAGFGKISTDIKALKEQIMNNKRRLAQATAMREKNLAAFRKEEKETVQAITNLKNAVSVLGRHQGGSLLQLEKPVLSGLRVMLRDVGIKYEMLLASKGRFGSKKGAALLSLGTNGKHGVSSALLDALEGHGDVGAFPMKFAQREVARAAHEAGASAFLQSKTAPSGGSYNAQSDGIFGILTTMLEEFEADLSSSQKEELKSQEDYSALAKAKESQIEIAKAKLDDIEGQNAENIKALSDAKENLEITRKQRTEDVTFLKNLQTTCNDLDTQWEKRSATRSAETTAVAETISILTDDDNREMTDKSVKFLQEFSNLEGSTSMRARRTQAVKSLRSASQDPNFDAEDLLSAWRGRRSAIGAAAGPRRQLSTLALAVSLDSFGKVKEMMDKMVVELKKQQQEEAEFKSYCTKEFSENEKAVYDKTEEKEDLETKIAQLEKQIKTLEGEIAAANAQMADAEKEILKASQAREAENAEFQTTVADQRATQEILKKALLRLADFYTKGKGNKMFVQKSEQTPPVKFNEFKTNAGASGVMGMIEQIVEDSVKLVSESTAAEYQAQADYEKFVKDSNDLTADLTEAVTKKTKSVAAAKLESAQSTGSHESAVGELASLADYEADLHAECDFTMKNFEVRQAARLQEMEAIQGAKAILSGAQ